MAWVRGTGDKRLGRSFFGEVEVWLRVVDSGRRMAIKKRRMDYGGLHCSFVRASRSKALNGKDSIHRRHLWPAGRPGERR